MKSAEEIYDTYLGRRKALMPVHAAAGVIQSIYDGNYDVQLPEIDSVEATAAANNIQTGLDQHAMRIASVQPNLICPATKTTKQGLKNANQRKLAIQAWWYLNHLETMARFRARDLIGMSMSPVVVRPGTEGFPRWELRRPTETFPSPGPRDELVPQDCIFEFKRSKKWLHEYYPDFSFKLERDSDNEIKILQFISHDQYAMVAMGDEDSRNPIPEMLASIPNRAGRPCVVVPGRITLGRLQGQFDQLVGLYATRAKLWALQIHAVMREVFGETWAQSTAQGGLPVIEKESDPYEGITGIVRDGTIQQFRVQSSQGPLQAIDRLDRSEKANGAIPNEFVGESTNNARTGRRGGQIMSATVDFYTQEHQILLAQSREEEDKIAIAIAKSYYGDGPKTFYIPIGKGQVSYTPNVTFETDSHSVSYSYAGTDTNGLVIEGGQRLAQKSLSRRSFMEIDPFVTDAEAEHDLIVRESIEDALLQSILQQAAMPDGPWTPSALGRLTELVYTQDLELWQAVDKVQKEAQEAQAAAAQAQQPGAMTPPGMEQQPGLAPAGAPGTPDAGIAGPNPSQMNLSMLLSNLRNPQRGQQGVPA